MLDGSRSDLAVVVGVGALLFALPFVVVIADRVLHTVEVGVDFAAHQHLPAIGTGAAKDTKITVVVASGKVVVPEGQVGRDWSLASNELARAGLNPKRVDVESDETPGTVVSVEKEGRRVDVGSEIKVEVATAPTPEPTTETVTQTVTQSATTEPQTTTATTEPPGGGGNGD